MSADQFYLYVSVLIFAPWAMLIVAPRWRYTEPIAFGSAFLLLAAAAYFTLSYLFAESNDGGNLFTLEGLKGLFRSKEMLLTGWLNYLSFCLFAGTWQVHDARLEKIPHWLLVPSLLLTLLTGPTGLLLYVLLRFMKTRKWDLR